MEDRKVEIALKQHVTVGSYGNYEKHEFYVGLGAEPSPGESRTDVANALLKDAHAILDAELENLASNDTGAGQRIIDSKRSAMESKAPQNAPATPPEETALGSAFTCSGCNTQVKDTPGNRKSLAYAQEKGYDPLCYNCKTERGIIKPRT